MAKQWLYVLVFCLPLFAVNLKHSHDWGDDFAQYISQAQHILSNTPQLQTGYIYNTTNPMLGPPAYPIGFPLLLAPVLALFGTSIYAMDVFMTCIVASLALLCYNYFKRHFSTTLSYLLVVLFVYHPWMLNFKMEVMSDLPFSALLLAFVLLYEQGAKTGTSSKSNSAFNGNAGRVRLIILSLLLGCIISVRAIGSVVCLALLWEAAITLLKWSNKAYSVQALVKYLIKSLGILTGCLIYYIANRYLFHTLANGYSAYQRIIDVSSLVQVVHTNAIYYPKVVIAFLAQMNGQMHIFSVAVGVLLFLCMLVGGIKKWLTSFEFSDRLLIVYLATIVVYPYSHAGFRFILPLAPFLIAYIVIGIQSFQPLFKKYIVKYIVNMATKYKLATKIGARICADIDAIIIIGIASVVFLTYLPGISACIADRNNELAGPYDAQSESAFQFIETHTPATARIDFAKPRVLALLTHRQGFCHLPNQSLPEIANALNQYSIDYVLINNQLSDDSIKAFVNQGKSGAALQWSNTKFKLYKINR